jgi:hypothetical protein
LLCPLLATAVQAAPVSLDLLLRPSGIDQLSLSPSGSRVAALFKGRDSDSDLLVLALQSGKLVPVMSTHLGPQQSIASYTWLSDDFLAIYYESPDQDFNRFSIASLAKHSIKVEDPLTQIVKAPWGDADHILLSVTGENCRATVAARCLMTLNLRGGVSNSISDPLTLLPANFLAVSPTEIYASGRDAHGAQRDLVLDPDTHAWKAVQNGTVAHRREALWQAERLPDEVLQQEASNGMQGAIPVWTAPDHRLVGLVGHAPQRAFLALDPRLNGLQALLEQKFPDARVALSRLNQSLTRGMVQIWAPDQPPRYLLFNDSGGLTEYPLLTPRFSPAMLGTTYVERDWADGMPAAVTLPPQGVALIGAVVEPFVAAAGAGEDPLYAYDGTRQAFAQMGIAVVRALTVMPGEFPSNAAGGEWRQMQAARFQRVIEHVSALVRGKPVCLLGTGTDGALALAWSGLPHVGCVISAGARLDSQAFGRNVQMFSMQSGATPLGAGMASVNVTASDAELHREVPAIFGVPGSDKLADSVQWVPNLPPKVMLAYDMKRRIEMQYAAESGGFRTAAKGAGKDLTYYTDSDTAAAGDIQSQMRLLTAVVDYVHNYFSAAGDASRNQ